MIMLVACGFIVSHLAGGSTASSESRRRDLVDRELKDSNGYPMGYPSYAIPENDSYPYYNSKTGKRTLYPAEKCFWTKDGKAKLTPTLVLLNEHIGVNEPTVCPECGRPVRGHNPLPPAELMEAAAKELQK